MSDPSTTAVAERAPAPPRVLFVLDHHVKYAAGLARGLESVGCPVTMLTRTHDWEFGLEAGAMVRWMERELEGTGVAWERLEGRARDLGTVPAVTGIRRRIRRFGPEVLHLQESVVDDWRLLAAAPPRPGRYAITIHDAVQHPGDLVRSAWKRRLQDELVRRAGVVFVHAEPVRAALIERTGTRAPVVVVPHGVRPPEPLPLPERPSLLFFGRLSAYKGLDVLLDAVSLLWSRGVDVELTVAGAGPLEPHPALDDPRLTLRHEHVAEEELPALFGAASCVVLPYREASQSGVATLARRYGRAIVASAVGGLPEMVDDEVGRLVAPGDPDALAGALEELLAESGALERMGRAAAARAAGEGSFSRVAELTVQAYRRHLPPA